MLHKREDRHAEKAHKVGIFIDMIHAAEGLKSNVVFRKWLAGALEVLRSLRLWIFFIMSAFPHKSFYATGR
jgi:hypothetical protein